MRNFDDRIENLGATAAGRLSADEDNVRFKELENAVTGFGISLDPQSGPDADLVMLGQAMSRAASRGVFGTCSGSANTYVVTAPVGVPVPKALFEGMLVITTMSATNTGASTANVFGLGVKDIKLFDGTSDPAAGALVSGRPTAWQYNGTAWELLPWADASIQASNITVNNFTATLRAAISPKVVADRTLATVAHETVVSLTSYDSTNTEGFTTSTFSGGIFTVGSGEAGIYDITGLFQTEATAGEILAEAMISINSGAVLLGQSSTKRNGPSRGCRAAFATTRTLSVGDTLQLQIYHSNASAVARAGYVRMSVVRLGA